MLQACQRGGWRLFLSVSTFNLKRATMYAYDSMPKNLLKYWTNNKCNRATGLESSNGMQHTEWQNVTVSVMQLVSVAHSSFGKTFSGIALDAVLLNTLRVCSD